MTNLKVFGVASYGGHLMQLLELMRHFELCDNFLFTTKMPDSSDAGIFEYIRVIPDFNRTNPIASLKTAFLALHELVNKKPDIVLTTGAAPGLIFIVVGRILGVKTVWVDSIANAEELSLSGRIAKRVANLCLSQWPHVSKDAKVKYLGSIL